MFKNHCPYETEGSGSLGELRGQAFASVPCPLGSRDTEGGRGAVTWAWLVWIRTLPSLMQGTGQWRPSSCSGILYSRGDGWRDILAI